MPDPAEALPHIWIEGGATDQTFSRQGGGRKKIRPVQAQAHGLAIRRDLDAAISAQVDARGELDDELVDELTAIGVIVVLEGADPAFPLRVESLERLSTHRARLPMWRLLSVTPPDRERPERASVWVSDRFRERFVRLFEDYLTKTTPNGHPQQQELVANIGRIQKAVLENLWQSEGRPETGAAWREIWLVPTDDAEGLLRAYAETRNLPMHDRALRLVDRTVCWVKASWDELVALPFTAVPVAEVRRPEFLDTLEDLPRVDQDTLAEDLADRVSAAPPEAPAVCHIDTGVRASHVLLTASLATSDVHSVVDDTGFDTRNHGTSMAGLGLYGPLDEPLLAAGAVKLRHRAESVKILPDTGQNLEEAYGLITAQAVALPEATVGRPRVFCMPVTTAPDLPGQPTLWSASVDALAAGVDIAASPNGIDLLSPPDHDAARLFVISAGNVGPEDFQDDYLAACDASPIQDPAHAWNALAVGGYTDLVQLPEDPTFAGWSTVAQAGDLSPHSRTSVLFSHRTWPIKPDFCMEGGNVLHDGATSYNEAHPLLSVRTIDARGDFALGSANATSAATAQAARLAALAMGRYPSYWPETVRGLLVHGSRWTVPMWESIRDASGKGPRLALLRRYGWGVPTESSVLESGRAAVTMVSQDSFTPFTGDDFAMRTFRLHTLPWPVEVLRELGGATVTMRVTLSYFIEPAASRRGWRRRYSYASHGLRFELKTATESTNEFVRRVNHDAQKEEDGTGGSNSGAERWMIGPNQRNTGSLHQDLWEGSAADLAECNVLAVHAVGGWWKNGKRKDRCNLPVRCALLVSLTTEEEGVDLYTPIAVEVGQPVDVSIST